MSTSNTDAMSTPIWSAPNNTHIPLVEWLRSTSNLAYPYMGFHALETHDLHVAKDFLNMGRKLLRTEADAIREMVDLGGHLFYHSEGEEAHFAWEKAIVKMGFVQGKKGISYLSGAWYVGMATGPLESLNGLAKGWYGKKIRVRHEVPPTEMYMLCRTRGNFGLMSIGEEKSPFESGNYPPEIVESFNFCKKGLLAKVPAGRLIIIDGLPGTGKTRFIRSLTSTVQDRGVVILVPEHLTADLADPDIIPVLKGARDNGTGPLILVLEDADDCLKSREESDSRGTTKALASLLNLSDGIVGAMLDIRIIASTNIRITKMDPAVMRPGRLLARVQFGPISAAQAQDVYKRLTRGKDLPDAKEMTLAEVYAAAEALTRE